ncbi:MAG: hypothetical protein FJ044_01155 [Candidatus Cloacimonetes bacterium]|nr:hypothetical protein [Candidatus Cloacimonadota bacterium]
MITGISPIEEQLDKIRNKEYKILKTRFGGKVYAWLDWMKKETEKTLENYGYTQKQIAPDSSRIIKQ